MVQAAQIHYRLIHICPSCFHIWFVCVINALSLSHFLFYLCLLGFSYCLTWHLFLSSAYQAHLIASCFASLFFFTFCYFQSVCPLPILPSPTYFLCAHFLYLSCWYFESAACFFFLFFILFFVCFVHVHSHCFTMPRAIWVFVPLTHWGHCLKTEMWVSNVFGGILQLFAFSFISTQTK